MCVEQQSKSPQGLSCHEVAAELLMLRHVGSSRCCAKPPQMGGILQSARSEKTFKSIKSGHWVHVSKPGFEINLPPVPSFLSQDMNGLEEGVEFLPAMNSKKMEKRGPKRCVVITAIISALVLVSVATGLLVWHFKCKCVCGCPL